MRKLGFIVKGLMVSTFLLFLAGCTVRTVQTSRSYTPPSSTVSDSTPQYAEQAVVEEDLPEITSDVSITIAPPIVMEEPVYYTPPIAVAYPYNYFYYSTDPSGYVNLVFVDAYNRRHVENWVVAGARMQRAALDTWRRNYRISAAAYRNHRSHVNERRHERRAERAGARNDRQDARKDARHDRQDARKDVRQDRQDARKDVRQDRQDARKDVRQDRQDARKDSHSNNMNTKPPTDHQSPKMNQPQKNDQMHSRPQTNMPRSNPAQRPAALPKPVATPKPAPAPKHVPNNIKKNNF